MISIGLRVIREKTMTSSSAYQLQTRIGVRHQLSRKYGCVASHIDALIFDIHM